jgi:hypothetical protein
MSRPKSLTAFLNILPLNVRNIYILAVHNRNEGFMVVEPRVLLGPKGLNNIRPKINIGSRRSGIGRRAEHYMSSKAVCQPNCWYTVEKDI